MQLCERILLCTNTQSIILQSLATRITADPLQFCEEGILQQYTHIFLNKIRSLIYQQMGHANGGEVIDISSSSLDAIFQLISRQKLTHLQKLFGIDASTRQRGVLKNASVHECINVGFQESL